MILSLSLPIHNMIVICSYELLAHRDRCDMMMMVMMMMLLIIKFSAVEAQRSKHLT